MINSSSWRLAKNLIAFVCVCLLAGTPESGAEDSEIPSHWETYSVESGKHSNSGNQFVLAYSETVSIAGAEWLYLPFDAWDLGKESYVILTSMEDWAHQQHDAETLAAYGGATAFFNGSEVIIDLWVAPGEEGVYVSIVEVLVGDPVESEVSLDADFEWAPPVAQPDETVHFTDKSTLAVTWSWDFGDGTTSNLQNPDHVFSQTFIYDVTLTVSDGTTTDSVTKEVTVIGTLYARFTWIPDHPLPGEVVRFIDQSIGSPSSWDWDFGDGTTSTEKNPVHVFVDEGIYDVRLTVTTGRESSTIDHQVRVGLPGPPQCEQLTYASSDNAVGRIWMIKPNGSTHHMSGWIASNGALISCKHSFNFPQEQVFFQFGDLEPAEGGTPALPDPSDQYIVSEVVGFADNACVGGDWLVFRVLPNSEHGMYPIQRQQDFYRLSIDLPEDGGNFTQIQETGFGGNEGTLKTGPGWFGGYGYTFNGVYVPEVYLADIGLIVGMSGGPYSLPGTKLAFGLGSATCYNECGSDYALGPSFRNQAFRNVLNYYTHDPAVPVSNVVYLDNWLHPFYNNDANGEITSPFQTLSLASENVSEGGLVRIIKGCYNNKWGDLIRIDKAMRLEAPVGNVIIGRDCP